MIIAIINGVDKTPQSLPPPPPTPSSILCLSSSAALNSIFWLHFFSTYIQIGLVLPYCTSSSAVIQSVHTVWQKHIWLEVNDNIEKWMRIFMLFRSKNLDVFFAFEIIICIYTSSLAVFNPFCWTSKMLNIISGTFQSNHIQRTTHNERLDLIIFCCCSKLFISRITRMICVRCALSCADWCWRSLVCSLVSKLNWYHRHKIDECRHWLITIFG